MNVTGGRVPCHHLRGDVRTRPFVMSPGIPTQFGPAAENVTADPSPCHIPGA